LSVGVTACASASRAFQPLPASTWRRKKRYKSHCATHGPLRLVELVMLDPMSTFSSRLVSLLLMLAQDALHFLFILVASVSRVLELAPVCCTTTLCLLRDNSGRAGLDLGQPSVKMGSIQQFFGTLLRDGASAWRSLSSTALFAGIASTATVLFVVDTFRTWYRLSHVPGPFFASISKFWMVRQSLKGQQPYAIQELNEKYGKSHVVSQAKTSVP
jgi:hypothetical protein